MMASRTQKQIPSDELKALLRIEELLKVLAKSALSTKTATILKDKKLRLLYEGAGQVPVKKLAKTTGFSVGKISGSWQAWEQVGLLAKDGGQYRRIL
jgi:hypothetical protein